jgi:hypothetical protein
LACHCHSKLRGHIAGAFHPTVDKDHANGMSCALFVFFDRVFLIKGK